MAHKLDRKELKKPDEFQLVAGKAMEWLVAHQRPVITALLVVVGVAVAVWGISAWRSSRETKAGAALAEALELQSRPIAGEGPQQPGQETFPSKEEREKSVMAALGSDSFVRFRVWRSESHPASMESARLFSNRFLFAMAITGVIGNGRG